MHLYEVNKIIEYSSKNRLPCQFLEWDSFQKVLGERYMSEIRYACCVVNIKHNDVTVWSDVAPVCI